MILPIYIPSSFSLVIMDIEENYSSVSVSFIYIKYNLHILTKTAFEEIGHERWTGFQ